MFELFNVKNILNYSNKVIICIIKVVCNKSVAINTVTIEKKEVLHMHYFSDLKIIEVHLQSIPENIRLIGGFFI